jgi:protein arginine kinase activator
MGITKNYTGTLPNRLENFKSSLNDRVVLQEKLQKAIQEENYEKAAVYRDKLKMLDNQSIEEVSE